MWDSGENSETQWGELCLEGHRGWEGAVPRGARASSALGQRDWHCPNPKFWRGFVAFPGYPIGEQGACPVCAPCDTSETVPGELPCSQDPFRVTVSPNPTLISRHLKLFPRCFMPQIGAELSHRVFLLFVYQITTENSSLTSWLFKGKKNLSSVHISSYPLQNSNSSSDPEAGPELLKQNPKMFAANTHPLLSSIYIKHADTTLGRLSRMLSQLLKFAHEMEDVLIKRRVSWIFFSHLFPCVKIKAEFLQAFCPFFFFSVPLVQLFGFFPSRLGFLCIFFS